MGLRQHRPRRHHLQDAGGQAGCGNRPQQGVGAGITPLADDDDLQSRQTGGGGIQQPGNAQYRLCRHAAEGIEGAVGIGGQVRIPGQIIQPGHGLDDHGVAGRIGFIEDRFGTDDDRPGIAGRSVESACFFVPMEIKGLAHPAAGGGEIVLAAGGFHQGEGGPGHPGQSFDGGRAALDSHRPGMAELAVRGLQVAGDKVKSRRRRPDPGRFPESQTGFGQRRDNHAVPVRQDFVVAPRPGPLGAVFFELAEEGV